MDRKELAEKVSEDVGMSPRRVEDVLSFAIYRIEEEVIAGRSVDLRGFGSFIARFRRSKKIRHPATGVMKMAESKYMPAFVPTKTFRNLVAKNKYSKGLYKPLLSIER